MSIIIYHRISHDAETRTHIVRDSITNDKTISKKLNTFRAKK